MTYHKHYPVGSIARDSEPPRYVPGAINPPLYAPPLSEADTWPSVPQPVPVARRLPCAPAPRHHGWLYWRLAWLRWDVETLVDEARLHTGWLGQLAFLVALAVCSAAFVVMVLLVWFALTGAGL